MLKIAVAGMWHLGSVTAACLASLGHNVVAIDEATDVLQELARARPPVSEPGLPEMIADQIASGRLNFSNDFSDAANADVVWITWDTPVDGEDKADIEFVHKRALRLLEHMRDASVLVVSSQMPVGSVGRLERESLHGEKNRHVGFACVPENLRLGRAIDVFLRPDRVVVGTRDERTRLVLEAVYGPIATRIEWMSVESAEMTKHAINSFLATSICFMNEMAILCERSGADAADVERGLKTEQRIGPRAYLHAGGPFAGGTLARDIAYMRSLGQQASVTIPLLDGVHASNEQHKKWLAKTMLRVFGSMAGRTIAILGLTYKPDTNTLRRSAAVDAAAWILQEGGHVRAFDPAIDHLTEEIDQAVLLCPDPYDAMKGADAVAIMTPWPQFQLLAPETAPPVVFDPGRFLEKTFGMAPEVRYYAVGRADDVRG